MVGFGNISNRHRKNLRKLFPSAIIYGMSSSGRNPATNPENCDEVVESISQMIALLPDFVIVASPANFHAIHSMPLIEAGIPVLIEKPVCATLFQASELADAVRSHHGKVSIAYCLRYLASTTFMKNAVENELVGKIYNIQIDTGQYLPDWRPTADYRKTVSANQNLGGGVLLELSHDIDYLIWIFGSFTVQKSILRSVAELETDVEDIADVMLSNDHGLVASLHLDFLQRAPKRQCVVIGTRGTLIWDLIQNEVWFDTNEGRQVLYDGSQEDRNNMYLQMLMDFADFAKSGTEPPICIDEAIETLRLVERIKNSSEVEIVK